jgi:hypothetical protein
MLRRSLSARCRVRVPGGYRGSALRRTGQYTRATSALLICPVGDRLVSTREPLRIWRICAHSCRHGLSSSGTPNLPIGMSERSRTVAGLSGEGAPRGQARVAQNSRRMAAVRAGSCSIHQWPSPSRATVRAPARAAALTAAAALRKGSSPGMITSPGAGMAAKSGPHCLPTNPATRSAWRWPSIRLVRAPPGRCRRQFARADQRRLNPRPRSLPARQRGPRGRRCPVSRLHLGRVSWPAATCRPSTHRC